VSTGFSTARRLTAATLAGAGAVSIVCAVAAPDDRQADAEWGAIIAAQGTTSGAPACARCHAFNGSADGSGAFPRIAGQPVFYLAKQLRDFISGVRTSAVMTPIAKALSSDDTTDVAAYYAGINPPFPPLPTPDPMLVKRGEQLASVGDAAKNLQSCNNCHGPGGVGEPPSIPYLAGQYAHYTAFELQMWRHGFRKSSPNEMARVAERLDDEDIAAVAAYFQQVRSSERAIAQRKD
jgi:cytochrome c553